MKKAKGQYPKPKQAGGQVIRELISGLRRANFRSQSVSHILIAVSAGPDSQALAHLICKYGRRVAPRSAIKLLHVQHRWRGADSEADAEFLKAHAREWGVPLICRTAPSPIHYQSGASWEDEARKIRKTIFEQEAALHQAAVFTAHQSDDVAETLLWRLFTGAAQTHGAGILPADGVEVRPLLSIRKALLIGYLKEEGVAYRNDSTNDDPRFLRARMRRELLPKIEELFPGSMAQLTKLGLNAPKAASLIDNAQFAAIFADAGIRIKRTHWDALKEKSANPNWSGQFHLPKGWKLVRERVEARPSKPLKIQDKLD